jgi:His-Xaa-Ser repeat protein HxsA
MSVRRFLIPSLLAAGLGGQGPAHGTLPQAMSGGGDDDHSRTNLLRRFAQDHYVTLAQHRSHSSHSSHRSSYGGGHYSHTSHRSSATGYDPYYEPSYAPVYTPPPSPPPPPPPPPAPAPLVSDPRLRASPPGAAFSSSAPLPALSGRTQRFASIVRRVQIALLAQGFFSGPITGTVGPATRGALRQFQRSRGLAVTGTITPQTLDALMVSSG